MDLGLLSPPTVRDAIGFIPPNTSHHDPIQFLLPELQTSRVHWEGQVNTLKTKGLESGCDVHPNGNRKFTPRELACFQSFPFHHTFAGSNTEIKKQIGNAVPPLLAKAILTEVRKALEHSDLLEEEPNFIMIVDDDIRDSGDDVIEYIPQDCAHGC